MRRGGHRDELGDDIDLGDIIAAERPSKLMPIWLRFYGIYGSADFNFKGVRS